MVDFDDFYVALEERFRGSYQTIKRRFEEYVPLVTAAGTGSHLGPILDLGCGRGEWLELLREKGIAAAAIDQNVKFVEMNRRRGLDVEISNIIDGLATKPADCYGAVTAFHVIEHLAPTEQLELLAGTRRVLKNGGMLILEWPNLENLRVGSYSFWMDPTHLRPLPVELVRFMAEYSGFVDIRIKRFRPGPKFANTGRDTLIRRLFRRLSGSDAVIEALNHLYLPGEDVALIARKPSQAANDDVRPSAGALGY